MSDPLATTHLGLPYLSPAQAQKHVTHNEALRSLDALVQIAVLDTTATDPPAAPTEGDRYVVAVSASGAWSGHDSELAAYVDGAWAFFAPADGWIVFDLASEALLVFHDGTWTPVGSFLGPIDQLGVNTTADATNRLAVHSNAALFTGIEAAEGGTGDIRFIVNKEADADTASLLFQSGFSGRAEVGLAGDTDFVFKVSANGADWVEAIRIDKDSGLPTILYDNTASGLTADTVQDAIDEVAGTGDAVASVFGRTGAVAAAASDYDASQIDNDSADVGGATVADALDAVFGELGSNANGTYVRFPNGLQICFRVVTTTHSGGSGNHETSSWTFPAAFDAAPYAAAAVNGTVNLSLLSQGGLVPPITYNLSSSSAQFRIYASAATSDTFEDGDQLNWYEIAVGTWS